MFRLLAAVATPLVLCTACFEKPSFTMADDPPSASTTPSSGIDDVMVLIPTSTIALSDVALPASAGGGDGKDKGKDKPPPPPPPKDAGSPGPGGGGDGSPAPAATATVQAPLTVGAFWIDTREVSATDYATCVTQGACTASSSSASPLCNTTGASPINCVTHDQARAFCTWQQKRLVQNDEWTVAAGGSAKARLYPWGDTAPTADHVNACGSECSATTSMYVASDGFVATAPRGSFSAGRSPDGVFDLAGNVAEWVDGVANLVRGGSYADAAAASIASNASRVVPDSTTDPTIGFRCARSP